MCDFRHFRYNRSRNYRPSRFRHREPIFSKSDPRPIFRISSRNYGPKNFRPRCKTAKRCSSIVIFLSRRRTRVCSHFSPARTTKYMRKGTLGVTAREVTVAKRTCKGNSTSLAFLWHLRPTGRALVIFLAPRAPHSPAASRRPSFPTGTCAFFPHPRRPLHAATSPPTTVAAARLAQALPRPRRRFPPRPPAPHPALAPPRPIQRDVGRGARQGTPVPTRPRQIWIATSVRKGPPPPPPPEMPRQPFLQRTTHQPAQGRRRASTLERRSLGRRPFQPLAREGQQLQLP